MANKVGCGSGSLKHKGGKVKGQMRAIWGFCVWPRMGISFCFVDIDLFQSTFGKDNVITAEIWNLIFPIVTLALGYIFGKGETK